MRAGNEAGPRAQDANTATDRRLSATMASRRLQVLNFVQDYIHQWHHSPSYGEIARGCGTNVARVHGAVKSLVGDGLLLQRTGARGLSLPSERDAAVRVLSELGYVVFDLQDAKAVTKPELQRRPVLDYDPRHGRETLGKKAVN